MAQEGRTIHEIEGLKPIQDLGTGLWMATVDINILKEQDKNAHVMNPTMFAQSVENIRQRGMPESLPLCALKDGNIEIISGHHRTRAAREAGCKQIPILVDTNNLTRSKIAAKQLAHNFLNGFDDKDMVAEIAKLITEVDDMIESYLENSKIEVQNIDVGSLLYPSMETDWKEISFMFLPAQFKRFADMVKDVGRKDAAYLIEEEKFKPFIEALGSFQKYQDIHSAGMAIDFLVRVANESLEEVGYNDNWQPIQSCVGGGSLPKKGAEIIRRAVKKMKKENVVPEKKPWMAIVKLCAEYLGEDCAGVC